MLNLKHLYYYQIYAQELNTAKAAKRLGITSPALSNQLKELERFIGAKLTRRIDGKVVITDRGEIVVHYAERMFSAYEELKARLIPSLEFKDKSFPIGISQYLGARFSFDLLSLIVKPPLTQSRAMHITFDSSDNL